MIQPSGQRLSGRLYGYYRWLYHNGRPNRLAQLMNRLGAIVFSTGLLLPRRAGTLEVVGRRSGQLISFPIVITEFEGARYVVAMLGSNTNWVRNVYAAGGMAVLRHGLRETVHLDEVNPSERAPILRRYLEIAPGARPHLPVDRRASLPEFERIAPHYPVFRVTTVSPLLHL
jgi:hypothetical protein